VDKLEDMLTLSTDLRYTCNAIKIPAVRHLGLASRVELGCACGKQARVTVDTDASSVGRRDGRGGGQRYDLSRRMSAAMVEGAMGTEQLQDFLTVLLRRPPPGKKLIQNGEKDYGMATKQVAEDSMRSVRIQEAKLARVNQHGVLTKKYDLAPKGIARAADGSYSRRGFDSDNGIVDETSTNVMSPTGGKCVSNCETYSRGCATCSWYSSQGKDIPEHDCGINFTGSARSMEPVGVRRMETRNRLEGLGSNQIVGDGDADVLKALREEWPEDHAEKWDDPNHFKGCTRRKMVGGKQTKEYVKNDHAVWAREQTGLLQYPAAVKRLGESAFGPMAADYLGALFLAVIHTHSDPREMNKAAEVAVHHAFDDHSGCDKAWCTSISDDAQVRDGPHFQRLPHQKPLVGKKLLSLLLEMVDKVMSPEICKRLIHGFHSQNCESFHQMVHSKCPKNRPQVSGSVFAGRALRAVAVKNLGPKDAIEQILEAQGVSPSKAVTTHFATKLAGRKRRNSKAATAEYKKRRKGAKMRKKLLNRNTEATEAYTYSKDTELFLPQ
jgi:hypothetical protein